jgi:hypothetical protein
MSLMSHSRRAQLGIYGRVLEKVIDTELEML